MVFNLKKDLPAGIVVFLVALPLCLGVALASGAPIISGIIAGISGGLIVAFFSGSHTSVSGPAAGLASVVLASIAKLGSFETFLVAVLIAGLIQIVMGFAKLGMVANYIPNNVIQGLLSAIGVILILKQIPHAIGFDRDPEDDFTFFQKDGENTFTELISAFDYVTPGALTIAVISLLILIYWDKSPMKKFSFIPASLVVVVLSTILNLVFMQFVPFFAIQDTHLVSLPEISASFWSNIVHIPSMEQWMNVQVWLVAITLAIIASLETLLNVEAIDKIDPAKRMTPPNRELVAQGLGNIFAGIFGGIPVTSVIVRSSVNIQAGNETKLSSIIHGFLMLLSVLLLSPIMNLIPLSSLAAILIFVGYKLASLDKIKAMYQKGWNQFLPFIITILAIVFTDLMRGVLIGLSISIFYLLLSNLRNPFTSEKNKLHIGEVVKLELPNIVSFFNKASIKETLWSLPEGTKLMIDASRSHYIDNDVLEIFEDFKEYVAHQRNIKINFIGLKKRYQIQDAIQFVNVLDKETQQKLTPPDILELLVSGNTRFVEGKTTDKYLSQQIMATANEQNPMAVLVGCIDSRTSPELLFDSGIGDLLTIRIAGNIITPEIVGSLEIAVKKLGAKLIVVKGHSSCGAVALSLANVNDENMGTVTSKIAAVAKLKGLMPAPSNKSHDQILDEVSRANAINSVKEILDSSPYLKKRVEMNEIGIVHAYHDLNSGIVHFGDINKI